MASSAAWRSYSAPLGVYRTGLSTMSSQRRSQRSGSWLRRVSGEGLSTYPNHDGLEPAKPDLQSMFSWTRLSAGR